MMPSFNDWTAGYGTLAFLLVSAAFYGGVQIYYRRQAKAQHAIDDGFAELMREMSQQRADEKARELLALADTLPPMPALPSSETINCRCAPILPAWQMDASDTSDEVVAYCPICALEGVTISGLRDAEGYYPLPRGKRVLCSEHTVRWEQRLDGDVL